MAKQEGTARRQKVDLIKYLLKMKFILLICIAFFSSTLVKGEEEELSIEIGKEFSEKLRSKVTKRLEYLGVAGESHASVSGAVSQNVFVIGFYHRNAEKGLMISIDEDQKIIAFYIKKSNISDMFLSKKVGWIRDKRLIISKKDIFFDEKLD